MIAGEHDFPAFSRDSYRATLGSWYADATVEMIRNSGHYPMSESPPFFARMVEEFIAARAS